MVSIALCDKISGISGCIRGRTTESDEDRDRILEQAAGKRIFYKSCHELNPAGFTEFKGNVFRIPSGDRNNGELPAHEKRLAPG
jgi:hypothetical protein